MRANQGTLSLRGWMYSGAETPEVQVRLERAQVPFELKRYARPDVRAARPDLAFSDDRIGFEIRITDLESYLQEDGSLRVRVTLGEQTFPVFQKSVAELAEEYAREASVAYNIDCIERRNDQIYVQGWAIHFEGKLSMQFEEENGEPITDAVWHYMNREDVQVEYEVGKDFCRGFAVDIPRASVKSNQLRLCFQTESGGKTAVFDMQQFDKENARPYRLRRLLSKVNRDRNRELLKKEGVRGFLDYLWEESSSSYNNYEEYFRRHKATARELRRQSRETFAYAPLFSIVVPLYKTPVPYLKELIDSVCAQSYPNWELCLADGSGEDSLGQMIRKNYAKEKRIRYRLLKDNSGIAGNTNAALDMVRGDFIVFADHDDTLEPDALYQAACVLRDAPDTEMIYSDEDLMDENGISFYPHVKPDFNLDYLRCINYICHLLIVKRGLYLKVGGLDSAYDGAQDYDFVLRCVEKTDQIRHIPRVLYHWRSHQGSTAGNQDSKSYAIDAGKRALQAHYARLGLEAEVEFTGTFIVFRSKFKVQGNPRVSILIPNKDHVDDLDLCIRSIEEKSTWKNIEILVIENNSEDPQTFAYYEQIQKQYPNVRIVTYTGPFNYSAINNVGAKAATGDYLLLLNNDTEVITPDWLEIMLGYGQREDVAIVGAKLYYPDDTIQHAGIVVGLGGFAGHVQTGLSKIHVGYLGRLITTQQISAVTGACLMVKRSVYEEVEGLDEGFAVALNDVDFCLRVREKGYHVIFAADAELYHYESKSRGYEDTPEKQVRFDHEVERFQKRHQAILDAGDPYYNPNLTLERGDCSMRKSHEFLKGR
jgi:GT2 family glycosyltransferase